LRSSWSYDMGLGTVVMHQCDTVVRSNGCHQTFAVPDYSVIDGLLQGTGFDTYLSSGKALKTDGPLSEVITYVTFWVIRILLKGELSEYEFHYWVAESAVAVRTSVIA
jgi:hypothetical protein